MSAVRTPGETLLFAFNGEPTGLRRPFSYPRVADACLMTALILRARART